MEDNWLQDYIISQTIQSLYYDKDTDRYIPDVVHLDESIIQTIVKKVQKKKGLDEKEIRQAINDVVQHIDGRPEVIILQDSVDLSQLIFGQILKFVFFSDKFGFCFIEGMLLQACNQIVILDTDINGLVYADKLVPTISTLQPGYDVTAGILRSQKNLLGKRFVRLPKLQRIELLNPTKVHHIVDKKYNATPSREILSTDLLDFTIMLLNEDSKQKDYDDLIKLSLSYGLSSFHVNEFIRCAKLFNNRHTQSTNKSKPNIDELIQINPLLEDHTFKHEISRLTKKLTELEKEKNEEISQLQQKKKRTAVVAWLSTCLAILALVFAIIWNQMRHTISDQTNEINSLTKKVSLLTNERDSLNIELHNTVEMLASARSEIKQLGKELTSKIDTIDYLQNDIQNLNKRLSSVSNDFSNFKKNISKQACIITDIQVANVDYNGNIKTNYGGYIRSGFTMFLHPKIIYIGLSAGNKIIYVKLFDSYGTLRSVAGAPSGYSFKEEKDIKLGKQEAYFTGLGGNNEGYWPAGTYRYEFYCDGKCIGTHEFTVH